MADKSKKKIAIYMAILSIVPTMVLIYAGSLIYLTWPISELSIDKSGVFGDSFGALTSMFSGLAFSGMIVTILLQRDELALQRNEIAENRIQFERSAAAQERSARLSALSTLLTEYKDQIDRNDVLLSSERFQISGPVSKVNAENEDLSARKQYIIVEIERLLKSQPEVA